MPSVRAEIVFVAFCFSFAGAVEGHDYDGNDFATEWVSYDSGLGASFFVFPETALGRPSVDTDYYGARRPVVPVYPEWKPDAIVTIGVGGHLILKFNHKVADDENNSYGLDFIVFGNAMAVIDGINNWDYGDPGAVILKSGQVGSELGKVSVSQDGVDWYSFDRGPYADSFAPTLGRVYDPNDPNNGYEGWDNRWWGEATNPTLPIDPNFQAGDFAGKSVAEFCAAYGNSAGGTGFDLEWLASEDYQGLSVDPNTGRRWIQYVKIECTAVDPEEGPLPEIDAVSDVSCCGDYKHPFPVGDISHNCAVDLEDLEILCGYWLCEISDSNDPAKAADIYKDDIVNLYDFALVGSSWLRCNAGYE